MAFTDWVRNSAEDIREEGASGAKRSIEELYYGARARVRRFHWITRDKRTLSVGGISFNVQQKHVGEFDHIRAHYNETWMAEDLVEELRPTDTFWDVGGNIGIYTLLAAECGAEVVAFEPWLQNAATIERNLKLNDLTARVVPKALANEDGSMEFTLDERETPGGGRGSLLDEWQDGRTRTVEAVRGDVAIRRDGVPAPTVVKVDVEGAELEVFRGLEDHLPEIRVIYCELHGIDDDEVRDLLDTNGFEIEADIDETECGIVKARRSG